MKTHEPSPGAIVDAGRHLDFIDALRGYAILGVMLTHVGQIVPHLPYPLYFTALYGQYGVQLFFIVSACTLFLAMQTRSVAKPRPIASFYMRRLFRIGPLFWVAVPFYVCFNGVGPQFWAPHGIGWPHVLLTSTLLHAWHPTTFNSVVPGGWSVAVEVTFYLVAPVLFAGIKSAGQAFRYALLLTIYARIVSLFLLEPAWAERSGVPSDLWTAFVEKSLINQLPAFFFGIMLYHLLRERHAGRIVRNERRMIASGVLIAAFTLGRVGGGVGQIFVGQTEAMSMLLLAFCWLVVVWPSKWLVHPPIRMLGTVSFSAYVWHWVVLSAVRHTLTKWCLANASPAVTLCVTFTAVALGTFVLAWASYQAIERPGQRLGKRLIARMQAKAASSVRMAGERAA